MCRSRPSPPTARGIRRLIRTIRQPQCAFAPYPAEQLEAALLYPWERWIVFLHPDQRALVERDWNGPARVTGSAGTGKTIVAIHRAAFLASADDTARVLLTTFSPRLARSLADKVDRLLARKPRVRERIEVRVLDDVVLQLWDTRGDGRAVLSDAEVVSLVRAEAKRKPVEGVSGTFAVSEWQHVVDTHGLRSWEAYRDVRRLGRKTRLAEPRRRALWSLFETVLRRLEERGEPFLQQVVTMHEAKGLEFRFVAVMACDDLVIPAEERITAVGDEADLEEVYASERHLLYVACTRARERLLVSGCEPVSEFLDDFGGTGL